MIGTKRNPSVNAYAAKSLELPGTEMSLLKTQKNIKVNNAGKVK